MNDMTGMDRVSVLISQWFADGGNDFEGGLALLEIVMQNKFYLNNIRKRGAARGIESVRYELNRRMGKISDRVVLRDGAGSNDKAPLTSPERGSDENGNGLVKKKANQ